MRDSNTHSALSPLFRGTQWLSMMGPTCFSRSAAPPKPPRARPRDLPSLPLFKPPHLPPLVFPRRPLSWRSATESLDARSAGDVCRRPWSMEGFRHQRSPGSDRFFGLFAPPLAANGTAVSAGEDELHEDDIFWTGADPPSSESNLSPAANPNPRPAGFRHLPERNLGILAALPEDDKKPPTPKARPAFPQRRATAAAVISTSPSSPSTSARMIPSVPKPEPEFALSMPGGKIRHHSAPVNVPTAPPKARRGSGKLEMDDGDLGGDEEMLPPHEILARRSRNGSPMTTFSVLEGVGRTLKGRDLRQVRNAVWRKTGFLD